MAGISAGRKQPQRHLIWARTPIENVGFGHQSALFSIFLQFVYIWPPTREGTVYWFIVPCSFLRDIRSPHQKALTHPPTIFRPYSYIEPFSCCLLFKDKQEKDPAQASRWTHNETLFFKKTKTSASWIPKRHDTVPQCSEISQCCACDPQGTFLSAVSTLSYQYLNYTCK